MVYLFPVSVTNFSLTVLRIYEQPPATTRADASSGLMAEKQTLAPRWVWGGVSTTPRRCVKNPPSPRERDERFLRDYKTDYQIRDKWDVHLTATG